MSIVKRVEVELNIEASEEMMAAVRAAKLRPLIPVGVKLRISQGYASSATLILPARFMLANVSGFCMM